MASDLPPKESPKRFAQMKRRLDAVKAENVEQRRVIRQLLDRLDALEQQYWTLKQATDQVIAAQAADILEMDDYIQKLESRLNPKTKPNQQKS